MVPRSGSQTSVLAADEFRRIMQCMGEPEQKDEYVLWKPWFGSRPAWAARAEPNRDRSGTPLNVQPSVDMKERHPPDPAAPPVEIPQTCADPAARGGTASCSVTASCSIRSFDDRPQRPSSARARRAPQTPCPTTKQAAHRPPWRAACSAPREAHDRSTGCRDVRGVREPSALSDVLQGAAAALARAGYDPRSLPAPQLGRSCTLHVDGNVRSAGIAMHRARPTSGTAADARRLEIVRAETARRKAATAAVLEEASQIRARGMRRK